MELWILFGTFTTLLLIGTPVAFCLGIASFATVLYMELPPIVLHASTQANNRDAAHVKFLADAGIRRVVLARELNLDQIRDIHEATDTELEFFVSGALCVSFSGNCYMSVANGERSAKLSGTSEHAATGDSHGRFFDFQILKGA